MLANSHFINHDMSRTPFDLLNDMAHFGTRQRLQPMKNDPFLLYIKTLSYIILLKGIDDDQNVVDEGSCHVR